MKKFFPVCAVILCLAACSAPVSSQSEFVLNTVCTVTLYNRGKPGIYREIFARFRDIENRMSAYIEGSDVDAVNRAAGTGPVKVRDDVFGVIEKALYYAELTDGAFDPTVKPLVSLWGIGSENPRVPLAEEIERVLPLVNWREVALDSAGHGVFIEQPGTALDLGAIAKGYAADEAAAIIRKAKIPRAIIDLGGNILTVGEKADRTLWKIGIQNPLDDRGSYIGIVQVREKTVVTSGVYERFFTAGDGTRYHHIFSTATGYPVDNNLLSVSVIADHSVDGDALSTSAFILGYERGRAFIESLEGTEAIFVFKDRTVRHTNGADFYLTDDTFSVAAD